MGRQAAPLSLQQVAGLLSGSLEGDPGLVILGVADLDRAGPGDIAFCDGPIATDRWGDLAAGAVIVAEDDTVVLVPGGPALVRVRDPRLAVAVLLSEMYPYEALEGVHPTASIGQGAWLGTGVGVGANAVIGAGCKIGDGAEIGAGCVLGRDVTIGLESRLSENCCLGDRVRVGARVILHPGVVLGADGFGYVQDGPRHVKLPQVGTVVIEEDVEIGANSCVDRATLHETRIGRRTKIDNLVQIGHNCIIGEDCMLSGQVGLSGSTVLENGVTMGGNVGTAGHLRIGSGAMIAAKSGVHRDVPAGALVGGYPAMEAPVWRRVVAALPMLPDILRRLRRAEKGIAKIEQVRK